ncbi:MAG: tripartite tricarboxylate transporter substrate binding protein [Burkholderiales bacterium]|nr:tripartite tricarboxylate transporter substrate binding protein [Burkholderiales bacterium]
MKFRMLCIAAAAGLSAASLPAFAQNYPVKPVRMIIPFAPGGNTDIIGRIFAPKMAEILGQPIIIDNRGGAGSIIGTEAAMRAAPDGYTLLLASAAHTINPAMVKKLPYDSIKDFTPLGVVADVPTAFVIHPSLPPKNVKEFVALAKARPNDIFYSTAGQGTVGHLAAELLISTTGAKLTGVHYKGSGPSMVDLVGGHVQTQFPSMPAAVPYVAQGRLRMIGQTGEKRSPAAPSVPTFIEQGYKDFVVSSGFAMFGPANLPKAIADRVNSAMAQALKDPKVNRTLLDQGAEPSGNSPEAHDKFNRAEIQKWIKVVKAAGIQPN